MLDKSAAWILNQGQYWNKMYVSKDSDVNDKVGVKWLILQKYA